MRCSFAVGPHSVPIRHHPLDFQCRHTTADFACMRCSAPFSLLFEIRCHSQLISLSLAMGSIPPALWRARLRVALSICFSVFLALWGSAPKKLASAHCLRVLLIRFTIDSANAICCHASQHVGFASISAQSAARMGK